MSRANGYSSPARTPEGVGPASSHVIFVGQGRDYHTMDWYRNAQALLAPLAVPYATDLIESEGHPGLLKPTDPRLDLFNIDWLMFRGQSRKGDIWRNLVKAAVIPVQVLKLRRIARTHARRADLVFHAHSMYYLWLCWLAGVNFVGTPQGSEILVRPQKSRLYRFLAIRALVAANKVTVDSVNMQDRIREMCGKEALVIQNGIDVAAILKFAAGPGTERTVILSNRGLYPIYRIDRILAGRARAGSTLALNFSYPFWEDSYKGECFKALRPADQDLGRLATRQQMYELLGRTLLVISIPESDSSPRSVYEAIFCGCCVATIYNPWIEVLPDCMKARLHLVDLARDDWFNQAVAHARVITRTPYVPSEAALDAFDQKRSLLRLAALCYGVRA